MKATIVAEIGSNLEGSVTKAKKIIRECSNPAECTIFCV
jgi:sialic acid synthase SpsE